MELSKSFSIDPDAEWVKRHNAEAREVLEAYEADKPIRVPLMGADGGHLHGFYADEIGLDYRDYYTDPELMMQVQLEAARRRRELPICDMALGELPESWPLVVDMHPVQAPSWLGCELLYRRNSVIAHRHRNLSKDECRAMDMPDPKNAGILKTIREFQETMKRRCDGLTFLGRPVGPVWHGVAQHGFFSLAVDLRGQDIMVDMIDDPGFADEFLLKVATWCDAFERTWCAEPEKPWPFGYSDHGIDMLSPGLYERFIVPVLKEMNRRRGTQPWKFLHHCGRGVHLFPIIRRHFGLEHIEALTFPLIDIARVRSELGEEVRITAVIADEIVQLGPPEAIRQTVKDLMESGAKGRGRLALEVGDLLRGVPLDHRLALYEAVKEFGGY